MSTFFSQNIQSLGGDSRTTLCIYGICVRTKHTRLCGYLLPGIKFFEKKLLIALVDYHLYGVGGLFFLIMYLVGDIRAIIC